jgi:hypothetical protein
MPFERAAQMMECLLGVQVSEATTRRQSEHAGALALAVQTAQAQAKPEVITSSAKAARLAVSADGAYVPLLKGHWAEVRTVAIGEVEQERAKNGEQEVHVRHLSYFSRMTDAETFADLAEVEMRRRAVSGAQEICAVTDGADWLQGFLDLHCPDAVRILDFLACCRASPSAHRRLTASRHGPAVRPARTIVPSAQTSRSASAPALALAPPGSSDASLKGCVNTWAICANGKR